MATSTAIDWLYGPNDGDVWPESVPEPQGPVLCTTTLKAPNGLPLLCRYLLAHRVNDDGTIRTALILDGWFENKPGDAYGPRTGGIVGMEDPS